MRSRSAGGIAHRIGTRVAKPTAFGAASVLAGILSGSIAPAFDPRNLSGTIQFALDASIDTTYYHPTTIGGYPVLKSLEAYGTSRAPRAGHCANFDLSNDYVQTTIPAQLGSLTFTCWIKPSSGALSGAGSSYGACIFSNCASNGVDLSFSASVGKTDAGADPTKFRFGHTGVGFNSTGSVSSSAWWHVAVVRSGSSGAWTYKCYINGVLDSTQTTASNPTTTSADKFTIGRLGAHNGLYYGGLLSDLRVYNVAKTAGEVAAIYGQADTPETIDTTGLVAHYWFNEAGGSNVFDYGPTKYNGACTGITTSTFWTSDSGVPYNPANFLGGRVGSNLLVSSDTAGSASAASVTANATTSPSGSSNASQFVPNSANTVHYISSQTYNPAAGSHVFSSHCKAGEVTSVKLYLYDPSGSGDSRGAIFDLSNGTITSTDATVTATIESKGSGWYRCSVSKTMGANATNGAGIISVVGGATSYAGNGSDGFYFWGSQIEYASTAGGYLSTGSTGGSKDVWVGRDEANPTKDITGTTLVYTGRCPHPAVVSPLCITTDGTSVYTTSAARISASAPTALTVSGYMTQSVANKVIFSEGMSASANTGWEVQTGTSDATQVAFYFGTAGAMATSPTGSLSSSTFKHICWVYDGTATGNANRIKLYVDGVQATLTFTGTVPASISMGTESFIIGQYAGLSYSTGKHADVRLFNVSKNSTEIAAIKLGTYDATGLLAQWPIQDGPGGSNTNRTIRDVSGNGRDLTLTNGTVSTIWANRCDYAQDWCVNYGGRMSSGVFIPGNVSGSNCVDGVAKVLSAGKHGNAGSRLKPNVYSCPELIRLGYTSSTALAPGDAVQATSPADTKFRRTAASGDDRYFATLAALTGSDKTNAQTYVT